MKLELSTENGNYIIAINGDVDAVSSIELDNALEQAISTNYKHILIDCFQLNYISSPGIGVFTSRLDDCEEKNIKLVLYGMSDKVFNVFKILGLHTVIPIVKDKEAAIQAIR